MSQSVFYYFCYTIFIFASKLTLYDSLHKIGKAAADWISMTPHEQSYFLSNRDWYTTPEDEGIDDFFFEDGRGYHIKDDAPEEAKKSYEEFYDILESNFTRVFFD